MPVRSNDASSFGHCPTSCRISNSSCNTQRRWNKTFRYEQHQNRYGHWYGRTHPAGRTRRGGPPPHHCQLGGTGGRAYSLETLESFSVCDTRQDPRKRIDQPRKKKRRLLAGQNSWRLILVKTLFRCFVWEEQRRTNRMPDRHPCRQQLSTRSKKHTERFCVDRTAPEARSAFHRTNTHTHIFQNDLKRCRCQTTSTTFNNNNILQQCRLVSI